MGLRSLSHETFQSANEAQLQARVGRGGELGTLPNYIGREYLMNFMNRGSDACRIEYEVVATHFF